MHFRTIDKSGGMYKDNSALTILLDRGMLTFVNILLQPIGLGSVNTI